MSVSVDIKKKLGDFTLDVAFEADRETLALLGASGCGKSMTLRCIAGIATPDEGIIRINGRVVFDSKNRINLKPQKRRVGFLFQNYALFPNMTVTENIMAALERERHLSRKQRQELAISYTRRLHLTGLENHYPAQLSGGQQQRTALARILAGQPDILLLDEPFSALDASLRWEMEQEVRQTIREFPGTCILVTHNRDEVYRLSDKVAVYNKGKIDVLAEKWNLFADPRTAVSARLSGCKNLSAAHVEGDCIVADDWGIPFPLLRPGPWTHVGIRAHRFTLCEAGTPFSFEYQLVSSIEDTFSYILSIRPKNRPDSPILRWETDKVIGPSVPETGFVAIPPEELLLLTD